MAVGHSWVACDGVAEEARAGEAQAQAQAQEQTLEGCGETLSWAHQHPRKLKLNARLIDKRSWAASLPLVRLLWTPWQEEKWREKWRKKFLEKSPRNSITMSRGCLDKKYLKIMTDCVKVTNPVKEVASGDRSRISKPVQFSVTTGSFKPKNQQRIRKYYKAFDENTFIYFT